MPPAPPATKCTHDFAGIHLLLASAVAAEFPIMSLSSARCFPLRFSLIDDDGIAELWLDVVVNSSPSLLPASDKAEAAVSFILERSPMFGQWYRAEVHVGSSLDLFYSAARPYLKATGLSLNLR